MVAPSGPIMFSAGYEGHIGSSSRIYRIIEIEIKLNGSKRKYKKAVLKKDLDC